MAMKRNSLMTKEMAAEMAVMENVISLGHDEFVGYAAFMNYALLGIEDVGTVIKTNNIWTSTLVASKVLKPFGFKTAWEAKEAQNVLNKDITWAANTIIGVWATVFGVIKNSEGVAYETALGYDDNKSAHDGFEYVKVELDSAKACYDRASKMDGALNLDEVEQFSLDAEAIKRFYGEYTIDATKKPQDFLRDKPFFGYMQNVRQRSSEELSVSIDRNDKHIITEGVNVGYENKNWEMNIPGLVIKTDKKGKPVDREDGRGPLYTYDMVDVYQLVRGEEGAAQYLVELAKLAAAVPTQVLPKEEIHELKLVKDAYKSTLVYGAIFMKNMWQSMTAAIRRLKKEVEKKYGKKSYTAEQYVKAQKKHNNECFAAITNQLRIMFEDANVMDPVTRVRVLLAAVINNGESLQRADWAKLSDFAHSALPEEWFCYTMHIMRNDAWTPAETMDKLTLLVELSDAQLTAINGRKVVLQDGMLVGKNNEVVGFVDGMDMNGEFVLRVADDGVYVCHDVVSLVEIPKADRNVTIFTTKSDRYTVANLNAILEGMMDKEVRLVPTDGDAIVVDGQKIGEFRCGLTKKLFNKDGSPKMKNGKQAFERLGVTTINGLYGGSNGVRGYVSEVVRGEYEEENGKLNKCAVIVLKNITAPMTDEEVDGIGYLPIKNLGNKEVKSPKVDRRAIGLKMNSAAAEF